MISHAFPPSKAVGAVRIGALHKFLLKQNYDVTVISSKESYSSNENKEKPRNGFKPSSYFRSIDRSVFSNFVFYNLRELLFSKAEYDVVIASYKPAGNIILGIFYKLLNLKVIQLL